MDRPSEQFYRDMRNRGILPMEAETALAEMVRAYDRFRRQVDPGYVGASSRKTNSRGGGATRMFEKAVIQAMENKASAEEWVSAQFAREYIPYPAQIQGESAQVAWQMNLSAAEKTHVQGIATALAGIQSYVAVLDFWRTKNQSTREILVRESRRFGALFRWCVASMSGFQDIAAESAKMARVIARTPGYLEAYQDAFPAIARALEELAS